MRRGADRLEDAALVLRKHRLHGPCQAASIGSSWVPAAQKQVRLFLGRWSSGKKKHFVVQDTFLVACVAPQVA